eukprot:jgi/Mesen1/10850/ME000093S10365
MGFHLVGHKAPPHSVRDRSRRPKLGEDKDEEAARNDHAIRSRSEEQIASSSAPHERDSFGRELRQGSSSERQTSSSRRSLSSTNSYVSMMRAMSGVRLSPDSPPASSPSSLATTPRRGEIEVEGYRLVPRSLTLPNSGKPLSSSGISQESMDAIDLLISDAKSPSTDVNRAAVRQLRLMSRASDENRGAIGAQGGVRPLLDLANSEDHEIQEEAVITLLNLSINNSNKRTMPSVGAIEEFVAIMRTGSQEMRENATAALFSLSVVDENKVLISSAGAIGPIVDVLQGGSDQGKRDACKALFNLSVLTANKARMVDLGGVPPLLALLEEASSDMAEKGVSVLANLATAPEGRCAIADAEDGIERLVEVLEAGTARGRENAAAALWLLAKNSEAHKALILREVVLPPLAALSQNGTPRAKEKARLLQAHLRDHGLPEESSASSQNGHSFGSSAWELGVAWIVSSASAVVQGKEPPPGAASTTNRFCYGGSLIKLVYFSRQPELPDSAAGFQRSASQSARANSSPSLRGYPSLGGRLHFVKFETSKLKDCLDFIESKKLHYLNSIGLDGDEDTVWGYGQGATRGATIKATGGGAYKYSDVFKERLKVTLDKEDEMGCLVAGLNFLLRAVRDEAYTHLDSEKQFVELDQNDIFPFLLVNIGSGVSILKGSPKVLSNVRGKGFKVDGVNQEEQVDGPGQYERVSGTNVGGGTFWGLGRLLTKCKSFDDILELSQGGDNAAVDMLVGDIYGGLDYSKIGLSASTIASSFGKAVGESKELEEYRPEDLALSLLRMISYNIGQISFLNAVRYNIKRIFFGGFFIRGHAYTMDTMSFAIKFWSKGAMQALFLRHEGFLGALGAFLSYDEHGLTNFTSSQLVERFPMGAPYARGEMSWMDKFLEIGSGITAPTPTTPPGPTGLGGFDRPMARSGSLRSDRSALNVGVLHLIPSMEPFPLLADPRGYEPNTIDLAEVEEREYWFRILDDHTPTLVDMAVASEGGTDDARRRGDAFARAFRAHLARLREEPAAYGRLGLANLLELREECLREFHFMDAYKSVKLRENEASLAVLPDLLTELDSLEPERRLLALIEGVLAANIFDWGSKACVELYQSGTILEIYRMSRSKMQRPWRVDDFDKFKERWFGKGGGAPAPAPHRKALLFADNSGADMVLGIIPLARELLRRGTEVVLVANSLPAINDVTAQELPPIIAAAAQHCDLLRRAAIAGGVIHDPASSSVGTPVVAEEGGPGAGGPHEQAGRGAEAGYRGNTPRLVVVESGSRSPCIDLRRVSADLAAASQGADLVVLEGMGRSLHTNFCARFQCESLKLAMVKNQRLAEQLVQGFIYDSVCQYEPPSTLD